MKSDIADRVEIRGVDFNKLYIVMKAFDNSAKVEPAPFIPSVETIDEAIRAAVREWREKRDPGEKLTLYQAPPTALIARKIHAVIGGTNG